MRLPPKRPVFKMLMERSRELNREVNEEWLKRMAKLEEEHDCSVGNFTDAMNKVWQSSQNTFFNPEDIKVFDPETLGLGIYRIYWRAGTTSVASVYEDSYGTRYIAPTDWHRPNVLESHMSDIYAVELILK